MGEMVAAIVAACLGSSGLTAIILALLQRRWAKQDRQDDKLDAVVDGIKVLTVDRVRYLGQRYIDQQEIALEDKETLKEMYAAYKQLGGNGHLDVVMAEIDRLPMEDKRHGH